MTFDFAHPYCLVHNQGTVSYTTGSILRTRQLADVPRSTGLPVISMVPYTQLRERGYVCHDGDEPIISLVPTEHRDVDLASFADADTPVRIGGEPVYTPDDAEFEAVVQRVIDQEICRGEGSNFLLSRRCDIDITDFGPDVAHAIFARLARNEFGAYLTFCFFDGERYFIGSSPERHLTYRHGTVTMNPICGTLPRSALHSRADLVQFLADPKEINELFQVVDEELKMMSRICREGGVVHGPYLKEMSALVHTEYVLEGTSTMAPIDAFRESMFAATMIGSPLENAARVIHRHESESRRYYSSALLITGREDDGEEWLDSAITIRTMEVERSGHAVIRSGASIVRDSVPWKETREVRAKAEGMLTAITGAQSPGRFLHQYVDPFVTDVLQLRNKYLSRFWTDRQTDDRYASPQLIGRTVLIIDNEDQFTEMLKHTLEHLGMKVTMSDYRDPEIALDGYDLVLVGPGPGDPNDLAMPKIARLHELTGQLLARGIPFLAVCLGHQILSRSLGMAVAAVDPPMQGVQETVDLFGRSEPVGFYNTFFAGAPAEVPAGVEVAAEADGRVIALRSERFYSFQFHVESVLTTNCITILREALLWLLR
ncbi:putative phenazine biosynthesis protein PhzE [Catellatospora sp. TT07R-123]|uniref:anthranilate synthase family protein n=1 Tax=Catellatospora sp. TT07R-123 TaxID=2733863 RepID=UPI001B1AD822|nr:anthranilate synthase family protein [Catellatospora sp. TT07R-123]GHJ48871.1 putative phenazine biosynthesis protein PhzE [Catellatospora sp. TT07R-123]